MVRHIVFSRLSGNPDETEKKKQLDFLKKFFCPLSGMIPAMRPYEGTMTLYPD